MEERLNNQQLNDIELTKKAMLASQLGPLNKFEDDEIKKKRKQEAKIQLLETEFTKFVEGYEVLATIVKEKQVAGIFQASEDTEKVPVSDCLLTINLKEEISAEKWEKIIKHNPDPCNLLGFSEQVILNFYVIAIELHLEARYEDAENAFAFLTVVKPYVASFWTGLGLALEGQKKYFEAIKAFKQAFETDTTDFSPILGMIRCSQETNSYAEVLKVLNEQSESDSIKDDVTTALAYIQSVK